MVATEAMRSRPDAHQGAVLDPLREFLSTRITVARGRGLRAAVGSAQLNPGNARSNLAESRMCARVGCSRLGKPTEDKRCAECGYATVPWSPEKAERLINPPRRVATKSEVLIVTTNEIPGYRVVKVHGDVFGVIVRARNYFSNMGASLRTVAGGEVGGYTKLLAQSRNEARERLKDEARSHGSNAVIAMRFDCNAIGDIMTEIAAYGTAVTVEPDPEAGPATSDPDVARP